jgi:hypothetical protein
LFILKFLKSTDGIITTADAISAIRKVIIFALSDAININQKIIGKI